MIVARSIPRSFASLRTAGVAAALTGEVATSGGTRAAPSAPSNVTNGEPTGIGVPHRRRATRHRPANGEGISTVGLRGLHLDERLVQRDGVAFAHEPRDDLALLQTLAEVRHREHALGHQYFTVRRTASAIRSTLGR